MSLNGLELLAFPLGQAPLPGNRTSSLNILELLAFAQGQAFPGKASGIFKWPRASCGWATGKPGDILKRLAASLFLLKN